MRRIIVLSFGYGFLGNAPDEAHIEEDVRDSLRNPYVKQQRWDWLSEVDGRYPELKEFVLSTQVAEGCETAQQILDRLARRVIALVATQDEVIVAIGCKAGRHRSVALAELLVSLLQSQGYNATFEHRSLKDALEGKPLIY